MSDATPALPSALRGWNAVLATAAVAGVTQVFWLTYSPVATESADFYGVSTGAIAALNLVYPALYVILAIPAGRLLDRSPRSTLMVGALLTAIGGVVRILGDTYAAGMAGQIIVSIAQPILLNGLIVVARANLPPEQRPAGIAAGSVGFFLGVLLGYSMPLALVNDGDLSALLAAQAALGVATGLWMVWAVRHTTAAHLADDVDTAVLRKVLRDPGIRVLAILALGGFGVFGALLAGVQPILKERGFSTDTADILIDVMIIAGLIVAAFLPPLAARRGTQRGVLLGAITVASVALALAAFDGPVVVLGVLFALVGAALVPALPILLEIAERRMPEVSGTVAAVIWLAGNLGVAILTGISSALYTVPAAAFVALAAAGGLTVAYTARQLTPELAAGDARLESAARLMLLRQLEFLDALAREQDTGRAAAACHVSPTSLSTGLKQLERELGLVLLHRGAQESLTAEGEAVLAWARGAISSMAGLEEEAARLRDGLAGTIRLGVIPTASARLGTLLAPFLREHPGVKVRAHTLPAREAVAKIIGRELDAALVYTSEPLGPGVKTLPLYEETLVLLTSDPAWTSRKATATWEEAASLPLCLLAPSLQNRTMVDRAMRAAGVRVDPQVEADSIPALIDLGRSGYSCIVADRWLDDRELPEGARIVTLVSPTVSPTVGLITAQRTLVSPSTRALRDALELSAAGVPTAAK